MSTTNPIRDEISKAISEHEVILFMKGRPEQPMCGFSARTVAALDALGASYAAVDILPDPRIRQELSAISNWPTIPQLFVNGELVGGCDIVTEMYESGELAQHGSASSRRPRLPRTPRWPPSRAPRPSQIKRRQPSPVAQGAPRRPRIAVIHHLQQPFLGNAAAPLGAVREHFGTLPDLDEVDAVVSFGGEKSAWEPELRPEVELIREAVRARSRSSASAWARSCWRTRSAVRSSRLRTPPRHVGADRGDRRRPGARRAPAGRARACTGTRTASSRRPARSRSTHARKAAARRASASAASRGASSSIRRSTRPRVDGWYAAWATCSRRPG